MLPPSYSFTTSKTGLVNVLANECEVSKAWLPSGSQPAPPMAKFKAIWDTGATRSVISQNVVNACGLARPFLSEFEEGLGYKARTG